MYELYTSNNGKNGIFSDNTLDMRGYNINSSGNGESGILNSGNVTLHLYDKNIMDINNNGEYGFLNDTGAFEYELHKAVDDNWYLKSNGRQSNVSKGIANISAVHLNIIKTGMNQ